MLYPGRQNGHIVIQREANATDIVDDYDSAIPSGMRGRAYSLNMLLQRLDLRLYRALVRYIIQNYTYDMGLLPSTHDWATLPSRWRYRGEGAPRRTRR